MMPRKKRSAPTDAETTATAPAAGASATEASPATPAAAEAALPPDVTERLAALEQEQDRLQHELADKETRIHELRDSLARTRADFANFRRRTREEQEEQAKFATALLVAELLPILDNFERALESIPHELRFFSWLQGIDLIHQMARAVLTKQGVTPIDAVGKPFDPNLHEAVLREGDGGGEVIVLEEMQKGYMMYNRVLRPSLVKVGPKPAPASAENQEPVATAEDTLRSGETGAHQ